MNDMLSNIFLGLFAFGFVMSFLSLILGGADGLFSSDGVHGNIGADGVSTGAHGADGVVGHSGDATGLDAGKMPFLNFTGILMFLTWFGATGFLLLKYSVLGVMLVMLLSAAAGFAGAYAIFLFYNKFLLAGETPMRPEDYYLPGTLARVVSGIRVGGTGEVVYLQGGTRKTAGARSDEGTAHPKGQEVVIVRYDKGLVYVKQMDSTLSSTTAASPNDPPGPVPGQEVH